MKTTFRALIFLCLISTFAFANPLGKKIEIGSITRSLLPSMNLDRMAFANGLDEIDETYWCDGRKDQSAHYAKAMLEDIAQIPDLSITPEDVSDYRQAYKDFFELCEIADADEHLQKGYNKFIRHYELLESTREVLMNELPR